MKHLYNSRFRVERIQLTDVGGRPQMEYAPAVSETEDVYEQEMLSRLPARLDLGFIRPGKDILPAPEAGKAPDRIGVLLTFPYAPIRAGDRLVAVENDEGKIPVEGTFELRVKPDEAMGFKDRHHLEMQVIEVNQNLTPNNWPAEEPLDDDEPEEEPEP